MLALTNPVYLLLTDKTNGAGILIIIKSHFDDYIHKKHLTKHIFKFWREVYIPHHQCFPNSVKG